MGGLAEEERDDGLGDVADILGVNCRVANERPHHQELPHVRPKHLPPPAVEALQERLADGVVRAVEYTCERVLQSQFREMPLGVVEVGGLEESAKILHLLQALLERDEINRRVRPHIAVVEELLAVLLANLPGRRPKERGVPSRVVRAVVPVLPEQLLAVQCVAVNRSGVGDVHPLRRETVGVPRRADPIV